MDGCRRWCITALATDSWSRSSLRLSAAEQLSQAMLAYSRRGRSIVLYSKDIVSTLTRARYPSFFRAAAFGAALFNMPDKWSDHFSVEYKTAESESLVDLNDEEDVVYSEKDLQLT